MTDAERVLFLLQPAGVAYLTGLMPEQADRDQLVAGALDQYADPRLAAAFVLETLCNAARVAATGSEGREKSITLGPIKLELVVNPSSTATAQADGFCAQAVTLRREVRRARSAVTQLASPIFVRAAPPVILNELADNP